MYLCIHSLMSLNLLLFYPEKNDHRLHAMQKSIFFFSRCEWKSVQAFVFIYLFSSHWRLFMILKPFLIGQSEECPCPSIHSFQPQGPLGSPQRRAEQRAASPGISEERWVQGSSTKTVMALCLEQDSRTSASSCLTVRFWLLNPPMSSSKRIICNKQSVYLISQ